ncbi:aromatic ring-hydroxylating oxygenase subunit alpha [Oceanibacterium hippocampi]|uniref:Anthranilate 1,2-dioxygenase large subunit n=1 Tax=Oceanibacterium hippocampi TaxID=745714 RepID=A0A1Y5TKV4_9PROT|nr:Rieske 2Fe-2S domain-containing protein [Oceanibacterium hippocampi]SLN66559.1 Anthranilate 1,2-dioxygenase large subunit [Oceanibacterium hippocampi]
MPRNAKEWAGVPDLPADHFISSEVYRDEGIFRDEQRLLLEKTWKFACHESEVEQVGDYRTLSFCGLPLVVIRGEDNRIRTFVNVCSHRSAELVRAPRGNARRMVCFFHLWAYDTYGNCVNQTRDIGYEEAGPKKEACGLRSIRTEVNCGLVFITLDDDAETLESFLADSLDTLREALTAEPLELFHYHSFKVRANWKQWHETNMELYHEWGHVVNRQQGLNSPGYHDRRISIGKNGHLSLPPYRVSYSNIPGWEDRDSNNFPGLAPGEIRAVDLFPNTSIIIRGTAMRIDTSTPISPSLTLMEFRGLGLKSDTPEVRAERIRNHNQYWGPFGRTQPEDGFFIESVEQGNRHAAQYSIISRRENLGAHDDAALRGYYAEWSRHMGRPAGDPKGNVSAEGPGK